ncbi:MAG: T9SS type A sorting domain-containing protein [Chitinophagaceae bacterium]|nr:T9SS type A sorting domain-containing protein [Chitinophagaceae bacterium]
MKTFFFSLFLFLSFSSFSQNNVSINFSDTSLIQKHIVIDTLNNPSNLWQIGSAVKSVFNEPYPARVIVTDSLNAYAPNNTSSFIFKVARPYMFGPANISTYLSFKYKLDKDSLDLFKVEVAADSAQHWVNMLTEDTTYQIVWYGNKPNFNAVDTGWRTFQANFSYWFKQYYGQANFPYYADADTFRFRFTFISDSIQSSGRDGCMIDQIQFTFLLGEQTTSISDLQPAIKFYPNPAHNKVYITRIVPAAGPESMSLYSIEGRLMEKFDVSAQPSVNLQLKAGTYILQYDSGETSAKQLLQIE